jgi:hypothetical protein
MTEEGAGKSVTCIVDRSILNEKTAGDLDDIMGGVFGPACGLNRGAFVLDPSDGHTYGCTDFPKSFADFAGIQGDVDIKDANAVKLQFEGGNITAAETIELIDIFSKSVYHSTANVEGDIYACNLNGLAYLDCGSRPIMPGMNGPIRSVTLAGLFVPAPWATGGVKLSLKQAAKFYTSSDFGDMVKLGLNTVLIPVPTSAFGSDASHSDEKVLSVLKDILDLVKDAGLEAIVALKATSGHAENESVLEAAAFCESHNVLAMELPSTADASATEAARKGSKTLSLFVPVKIGMLADLEVPDDNTFAALSMDHLGTVADVASSTAKDDRMKMFYHEAISCMARAPLEFTNCNRGVPVFVSGGFDLAIDDCAHKGILDSWRDYGQCGRMNETIDSGWWEHHRESFAARQLFAYERGLGWNFATWKLYGDDTTELDEPATLLALKNVVAAGLFPSLDEKHPASLACLNPPKPDFILGDETLAPSAGPPPDCGNGWWNITTGDCSYWVPPPTEPPCEVCEVCSTPTKDLGLAAAGGAVVGMVIGAMIFKIFKRQNDGYSSIPN